MVGDALLFIDSNKYLDLYRTDKGKKLLAPLVEQVDHIFVTQQVVDEVQRNKTTVAAEFLAGKVGRLKLQTFNVPDHLSGANVGLGIEILQRMKEICQKIKTVNNDLDSLASGIMDQISRSEDEVSKALAPVFAKAVSPSREELQRARSRKELGNPPGKNGDPIGDQLTWEQILTHFNGRKRLWIISRDGDYGTVFNGKAFLNQFLHDELRQLAADPEVYLFGDTVDGIIHFVETTGVTAESRLTAEEVAEIELEERSLLDFAKRSNDQQQRAMMVMADLAKQQSQIAEVENQALRLMANSRSNEVEQAAANRIFAESSRLMSQSVEIQKRLTVEVIGANEKKMLAHANKMVDFGNKVLATATAIEELERRARSDAEKLATFGAECSFASEVEELQRQAISDLDKIAHVQKEISILSQKFRKIDE